MTNEIKQYKRNLWFIVVETVLTSIGAGFSVSVMTIFWNSIGMNQTDIGFTQMMFTIVLVCLDIPMGYVADRFNRKVLNIVGDIGVAFTFLYYAFSQNMVMAIISECLLGLFIAMTNGVDQSFIKYNCNKIDESGKLFRKVNTSVFTVRYISLFTVALIGGFVAKYSLRVCIGLSFVPYFVGGIIAFFIKDFNGKMERKHSNPIKDMVINIKEIVKHKDARILLFAYSFSKEVTHPIIWVFTPLLIMVGIPMEIVSLGWILNYLMQIVGSRISAKMVNLKMSRKFMIPFLMQFAWMLVVILNVNIVTVWLFAFNGMVHGMLEGSMATGLQERTSDEVQTSVMSLASTIARIIYIPLVYFINYMGNMRLQLALFGNMVIFVPVFIILYLNLKKIEEI